MTDTTGNSCCGSSESPSRKRRLFKQVEWAWVASALLLLAVLVLDQDGFIPTVKFALNAITQTGVFIIFAVAAIGFLKATGAETLIAGVFTGSQVRMIILAALMGGLSPFCSCEVIPFIAALLALGTPLSAVMAFWLASPLMDPAMFSITWSALGFDFALAKTLFAIAIGIFGGFSVMLLSGTRIFASPLKDRDPGKKSCSSNSFSGAPVWAFWRETDRRDTFRDTVIENGLFLLKWLMLAYVFEALMVRYIPAGLIAQYLGGDGLTPIFLGGIVGAPAYLNGYAAVPLVQGLLAQGMAPGAAMSFMIAGGVSSIPAAIAVWALVKPRVFASYLVLAVIGAVSAGLIWNVIA